MSSPPIHFWTLLILCNVYFAQALPMIWGIAVGFVWLVMTIVAFIEDRSSSAGDK